MAESLIEHVALSVEARVADHPDTDLSVRETAREHTAGLTRNLRNLREETLLAVYDLAGQVAAGCVRGGARATRLSAKRLVALAVWGEIQGIVGIEGDPIPAAKSAADQMMHEAARSGIDITEVAAGTVRGVLGAADAGNLSTTPLARATLHGLREGARALNTNAESQLYRSLIDSSDLPVELIDEVFE